MTHTRKRIRKLSTAVFRGCRTEYDFDVYPISTAITDNPAVFIFSRRLVDKLGRWHHAVSCVGETESVVAEIKRHKRARCIKGNDANVICILKEVDSGLRRGVLDDIAAARTFSCVRGKFKPTINAASNGKTTKTAKILSFKPSTKIKAARADHAGKPVAGKPRRSAAKSGKRVEHDSKPGQKVVKGKASAGGKRVSSRVDSDGRQYRLSKPKKPVAGRAKARIAQNSRSRSKLAA
jgi:hypothetical protein